MLTWQYALPENFLDICALFEKAGLGSGVYEIARRVAFPLFFKKIIVFHENNALKGFVTFARMKDGIESQMLEKGILPLDWDNGNNFWVIDFASIGDGYKMLRMATKALDVKKCKYVRKKHNQLREVRAV